MTINLQDNKESTNNRIPVSHKQLKYVHTKKLTIASGPKTKHGRRPQHVEKVNCLFYSVINDIIESNNNYLKYDSVLMNCLLLSYKCLA